MFAGKLKCDFNYISHISLLNYTINKYVCIYVCVHTLGRLWGDTLTFPTTAITYQMMLCFVVFFVWLLVLSKFGLFAVVVIVIVQTILYYIVWPTTIV